MDFTTPAGPLREQILLSADKVINSCFAPVDPASGGPAAGQTVGVFIIKTLLQFFPQWINQNLTVLQGLVGLWRGAERSEVFSHERGSVELSDTLKWRSILDILMVYARNAPEDLNVLLDIIDVCSQPSAMDFSDVKFFVYDACSGFTVEQKKGCIVRFLQLLGDTTVPNSKKVMMHRLVVLPCLNIAHADGKLKSVLDKEVLTLLARIIWMAQHYQTEEGVYSDRAMQLDLLQLTAFMIERAPELVGEFRKELIRFTWNYVRNDETILRQASFVVLSLFIGNYDTPDKIVVQLFVTLLRSYQSEARILVKQYGLKAGQRQ